MFHQCSQALFIQMSWANWIHGNNVTFAKSYSASVKLQNICNKTATNMRYETINRQILQTRFLPQLFSSEESPQSSVPSHFCWWSIHLPLPQRNSCMEHLGWSNKCTTWVRTISEVCLGPSETYMIVKINSRKSLKR